ncbi:hypothetical protein ACE1SV_08640 [Streptomyces sp. E-15]
MHPWSDQPEPRSEAAGEHPWWDEALALVNRDLAATLPEQRPLRLIAWPADAEDEDEAERVYVALDSGDAHGNSLGPAPSSPTAALRAVAEAAQDTVMECLWQAWPVCTLHNLGMHLGEGEGEGEGAGGVVWWCAGSGRPDDPEHPRAAVGELDTVHRPRRPNRKRREPRESRERRDDRRPR